MSDEHIIFAFDGERLTPQNAAQRLYKAGFVDAKLLAIGYAVMMAESGRYLKAWHHNTLRNPDGSLNLDGEGKMTVKSTDLGFIQRNVQHDPWKVIPYDPVDGTQLAMDLFDQYPDLADGQKSSDIAWDLFTVRGWQPWYAHSNGSYKDGLPSACVAVGRFLAMVIAGNAEIVIHNPKYS